MTRSEPAVVLMLLEARYASNQAAQTSGDQTLEKRQ